MSHRASSMPAIALWVTPPRFWRVAPRMAHQRRPAGPWGPPRALLRGGAGRFPVEPLARPRVLADEQRGEILHGARDAVRTPVVAAFTPAHEPVVGLDANAGPGPPAAVTVQGLDARDLHGSGRCHSRPERTSRAATRATAG